MRKSLKVALLTLLFISMMAGSLAAQYLTPHVPADRNLYVGQAELWRWRTAYTQLFNGTDFTDWEVVGTSRTSVEDAAIDGTPNREVDSTSGLHRTTKLYRNFILKLQFQIEPNPNVEPSEYVDSGVFWRVPPGATRIADEGFEMELPATDDVEEPVGTIRHLARAYRGLCHFNFWNDVEILADGDYVRVTLNGQIASESFDRRSMEGYIALQHRKMGGVVRFRDILLQQLPDTPALPPTVEEQLETAPGVFVPIFNGRDLTGWSTPGPNNQSKWHVEDGAITLSPGAGNGNLVHESRYGDFILKLKFYMPDDGITRDGNSGIFVRGAFDGLNNGLEAQIESVRDWGHWNPTGSIYDISQALPGRFKYNDWNEYTIYVLGDRMVLYLNGFKTAAGIIPQNPAPTMATTNPGHIKIQSHAPYKKLQVKDIFIKEVKPGE